MVIRVLTVAQDVHAEFLPRRIARIRRQPKKFDSSKRLLSLHVNLKKEKTRLDRIRSLSFDRQATLK
jgi:hypothetical protein